MKELNSNKKISKARFALTKTKPYIATIIIFALFSLLFPVVLIIQMFEDDYSDTALIGFGMMTAFYSYIVLILTTVVPKCLSAKQSAIIKGNANMYDLFMQFPLTKKQVLTKVFRNWAFSSIVPIATTITLCVIPMFYKRAQDVNSQIGLVVILTALVLATTEVFTLLTVNSKIHKSTPFKVTYFIVLYVVFMFSMLCGDKTWFLNHIGGFEIFSGIVGVIILLAFVPLMWIITKLLVIDANGKEAWHYEKIG